MKPTSVKPRTTSCAVSSFCAAVAASRYLLKSMIGIRKLSYMNALGMWRDTLRASLRTSTCVAKVLLVHRAARAECDTDEFLGEAVTRLMVGRIAEGVLASMVPQAVSRGRQRRKVFEYAKEVVGRVRGGARASPSVDALSFAL